MRTRYEFDPMARIRLEVEATTTGLVNLVSNPSGALGAWGWITPVANSVLLSHRDVAPVLEYRAPNPAAASFFYTEPLSVVAGQYVGAKWESILISGFYRARLEWLNSSFAVLSSTAQTAYAQTGSGSITASLAPASTAFARLRFDTYSNTSAANPGASAQFQFRDVVVAKAATSAALGVSRTNLVANPSFETDTSSWAGQGGTIARTTAQAAVGSASLAITATTGASAFTYVTVTGGRDYTFQFQSRPATTARPTNIGVRWFDSDSQPIHAVTTSGTNAAGTWTLSAATFTAPANAVIGQFFLGTFDSTAGEVHYFDAVMVEEGFGVRPFITGTQANQFLGVIDPGYVNILGPTHDIKIGREGLNLGTLTATVLDTALDPATAATLRTGRKVRLMVLHSNQTWQAVLTGKLNKADVNYDLHARDPRKVSRISLTATDPTAPLANATRPDGVATIAALPYVLEGCGVPWNVNGSGNQVPAATVVSTNVNATAIDQIAITRDSVSGYAWVDRNGVLQAHDRDLVPSALPRATGSGDKDRFDVTMVQGSGNSVTFTTGDTAQFRSAPDSYRITTPTGGVQYAGFALREVPVVGGRTYRFRGYVRSAAVARRVGAYATFNGGPIVPPVTFPTVVTSTTTGWTLLEFTTTIPAGATTARLGLAVAQNDLMSPVLPAGEVHYFDDLSVAPVLDEDIYNPDLVVSFNPDACINEVAFKNIQWDPDDATKSIEVAYGPYRDEASIKDWDRHAAEFTVHGLTGVQVAALGAAILARNAVPTVRVQSVTLPIKTGDDLSSHALLDLYGLVYVKNTDRGLDHAAFITGIDHALTATGWLMTLTFASSTSVASPTVTPPVQSNGLPSDTGWITPAAMFNSWVDFGLGHVPTRYRRKDGIVYVQGLVKNGLIGQGVFVLPAGFRPAHQLVFGVVDGTNTANGRLDILSSGNVLPAAGNNSYFALNCAFPAEA